MPNASRRERKVVTVVFCDLVGFTSRSESLDPEDVEAFLGPYHARVRTELERHGGTVEKFIGDAVMALFGAPIAHEDDPERAVRAALEIRSFALGEGLELRVGVTTGVALVRLDASPSEGEGMAAGDVVNTAARLQSAAPVNGVLVDETTYRATRSSIEYEDAEPVEAKGKSEPVAVRLALQVRSRPGMDVAHEVRSPLVARERELAVLRDAFERARLARSAQLVTLVGVPGIGKSRLVFELSQIVEADPELVTWRQGRCLAYGEGVTLWALGEIVKAQAGIHEADEEPEVEGKVREAVRDVVEDASDAEWVASHLRTLVGLGSESELGGDRRGEAFSAWRHYFEAMALDRPLVLVFEDLHWADESLLDFVDELVEWVADVPLLVVATARPELLERRPGWGGGKLNATTLALAPLSDEETGELLAKMLARPVLGAESRQALLERAGGNPLYAEQFAELYLERGSVDELPLPETLQGVIAARIDGLAPDEKQLLRDAAVVGKVFWSGALRSADPSATLHSLERKGFVRRQRRTSVEGESELAFAHALGRDVAYGQIARAERAESHECVARWIEGLGRPDDHAEMLAHHYTAALELARAAGSDTDELTGRARQVLQAAGDRAFGLNAFPAAERYYADALALWPPDDPARPQLVFRHARALHAAGDARSERALEEACDVLLAAGDRESAAEAESFLSRVFWFRGLRDPAYEHLTRAEELLAGSAASVAKARVLATAARYRMLAGDPDDAIATATAALEIAQELSLDELRADALCTIGSSRGGADDPRGLAEQEEALAIALRANSPAAIRCANNLGHNTHDHLYANEMFRRAEELAQRFGDETHRRFSRANVIGSNYELGRWDGLEEAADVFVAACETSPHYSEAQVRLVRAELRLARGEAEGALADADRALEAARDAKDLQMLLPALVASARTRALLGRSGEARELATEAIAIARSHTGWARLLRDLSDVAEELGVSADTVAVLEERVWAPGAAVLRDATRAAARGDFARAGALYDELGLARLGAQSHLAAGEHLVRAGSGREGDAELGLALAFYRPRGSRFYIRRAEQLLAKTA
jgi:class 3 adenylate cyclase/tetratricopeptide (TPR) repeat protein